MEEEDFNQAESSNQDRVMPDSLDNTQQLSVQGQGGGAAEEEN